MAAPKAEELPWCGQCREPGRLDHAVLNPPGDPIPIDIIRRCPDCSPHPPGCGKHMIPPGRSCELCLRAIGERQPEPVYGGPPPQPPLPAEPIDLRTATVADLAAELSMIRDPSPPRRFLHERRDQLALRDIALREAAASRAGRGER